MGIFDQPQGAPGPILAVTISCDELEASASSYCGAFDYEHLESGKVSDKEANSWGPPQRFVRLVISVGLKELPGALRLIHVRRPETHRPLGQLGWAALEIAVSDVDSVVAAVSKWSFSILRPPAALKSSAALRAAQLTGPSGEVIYLTERLREVPGFDLPDPTKLVDRVFVAVLGTRDLDSARAPYEALGARRVSDHAVAIEVLNDAYSLPATHLHRLSSLQLAGKSLIEIDSYPVQAVQAARVPGELPWGVSMVTLSCDFQTCPAGFEEVGALESDDSASFGGNGRVVVRGLEGELVELVARQPMPKGWP